MPRGGRRGFNVNVTERVSDAPGAFEICGGGRVPAPARRAARTKARETERSKKNK